MLNVSPNAVKQLFQVTPPNTNAYSVFSKAAKRKVVLTGIYVVNTTANAATYSVFLSKSGTTYDATTALVYNKSLAANTEASHEYLFGQPLDALYAGNIAVQVGTANAITLTGVGIETI